MPIELTNKWLNRDASVSYLFVSIVFKVAGNSFLHFATLRFSWVIITTFYLLVLQPWYTKTVQSLVKTLLSLLWQDRLPEQPYDLLKTPLILVLSLVLSVLTDKTKIKGVFSRSYSCFCHTACFWVVLFGRVWNFCLGKSDRATSKFQISKVPWTHSPQKQPSFFNQRSMAAFTGYWAHKTAFFKILQKVAPYHAYRNLGCIVAMVTWIAIKVTIIGSPPLGILHDTNIIASLDKQR